MLEPHRVEAHRPARARTSRLWLGDIVLSSRCAMDPVSSVRFLPIGAVACAALPWWFQGSARMTVVIKASLSWTADVLPTALDAEPEPIARDGDDDDLVPYLMQNEVLCLGRGSANARGCLRLFRGDRTLLDASTSNTPASRPRSFAPIPISAPQRARLLDPEQARLATARPLRLPAEFPWQVFQAAPADQRTSQPLHGDETLVLDGLLAGSSRCALGLPHVRARAWILHKEQPIADLPLRLDRLRIDLERARLSLVWRACLAVRTSERLVVAAGAATRGEPVLLPRLDRSAADAMNETAATHVAGLHAETLPFKSNAKSDDRIARARAALAARRAMGTPWDKAVTATEPAPPSAKPATPALERTMAITPVDDAPASARNMHETMPLPRGAPLRESPWAPGVGLPSTPLATPLPAFLAEPRPTPSAGPAIGAVMLRPGLGSELLLALSEMRRPRR
jgi:hypothetical protein